MSKQIDATKLERIQEAAISLISRNGIANASVALIAKEAEVSVGYLYRHYAGKEELLNDLLDRVLTRIGDRIAQLVEQTGGIEETVEGIVRYIFETAGSQPDHVRFCLNMQNDLSSPISRQVLGRLKALCEDVFAEARKAGMIGKEVSAEDVYIIMLSVPLQYVGVRMRNVFGGFEPTDKEIRHVSRICLSAIKIDRR